MKKLKLKALDLSAIEVLSREQLKKVLGGDGTCAVTFNDAYASSAAYSNWSSSAMTVTTNPDGSRTYTLYGTDKTTASTVSGAGGSGAHWCCDSCSSASWYNPPEPNP